MGERQFLHEDVPGMMCGFGLNCRDAHFARLGMSSDTSRSGIWQDAACPAESDKCIATSSDRGSSLSQPESTLQWRPKAAGEPHAEDPTTPEREDCFVHRTQRPDPQQKIEFAQDPSLEDADLAGATICCYWLEKRCDYATTHRRGKRTFLHKDVPKLLCSYGTSCRFQHNVSRLDSKEGGALLPSPQVHLQIESGMLVCINSNREVRYAEVLEIASPVEKLNPVHVRFLLEDANASVSSEWLRMQQLLIPDYSGLERGMHVQVAVGSKLFLATIVQNSQDISRRRAPICIHQKGRPREDTEWVGAERLRSKALKFVPPGPLPEASHAKAPEPDPAPSPLADQLLCNEQRPPKAAAEPHDDNPTTSEREDCLVHRTQRPDPQQKIQIAQAEAKSIDVEPLPCDLLQASLGQSFICCQWLCGRCHESGSHVRGNRKFLHEKVAGMQCGYGLHCRYRHNQIRVLPRLEEEDMNSPMPDLLPKASHAKAPEPDPAPSPLADPLPWNEPETSEDEDALQCLEAAVHAAECALTACKSASSTEWLPQLEEVLRRSRGCGKLRSLLAMHGWTGGRFDNQPDLHCLLEGLIKMRQDMYEVSSDSSHCHSDAPRPKPSERLNDIASSCALSPESLEMQLSRQSNELGELAGTLVCGTFRCVAANADAPKQCGEVIVERGPKPLVGSKVRILSNKNRGHARDCDRCYVRILLVRCSAAVLQIVLLVSDTVRTYLRGCLGTDLPCWQTAAQSRIILQRRRCGQDSQFACFQALDARSVWRSI